MGEGGGRGEKCRHQSRRGSFESCNYLETVEMLREKKQEWMMDDPPNGDDPKSMNIYQTTCIVWFIIHAIINGASDHFSHLIGKWRMLKRLRILNGCVRNQTRLKGYSD